MKRNLSPRLSTYTAQQGAQFPASQRRTGFKTSGLMGLAGLLGLLLMAFPAFGQTPQYSDAVARLTIKSETLNEERVILVSTPPGYERGNQRYPVLYMTDGDAHMLHTTASMAFLARNGRIPEMIIVGITNTDRTRDLTPTNATFPPPDGAPNQFPTSGGADKFLKFIETELIPKIESQYRVQPYRILAGHSFGGLFTVHALVSRPELFNAYIAVSPSLNWDNDVVLKRAEEFFKGRKEWNRTLYVTLGNEPGGIYEGFKRFKKILAQYQPKGFEWEAAHMEDEDHGSVVLRSHYFGLRKVFAEWQMPRDPATGVIAGGLPAVEAHYAKLSQKYGFTVPVPEPLINQLGYQLLGAGKTEEAIAAFKANVERYPASANVYDSLAEAYERSGRLEMARPNYEKAYALGKENSDPNVALYKTNMERVVGKLNPGDAAVKK
ncbi:MAG: alpha/beta hydrolase-fold protein [Pyrinomonadaceae bacterium]